MAEDRNFDGRPGNDSESRSYAYIYDNPAFGQETTNLPEDATRVLAASLQQEEDRREQDAHDAELESQRQVHFFPSVGKFIVPVENTWAAHIELVKDDRQALGFNPDKYVYFDKIIAQKLGMPALYDKTDKDYAKWEGLRTNLEVLRNDIIGIYLKDGAFNPGDEIYIPYLTSIASALGDALSSDKWYKRAFFPSVSLDVANVEGTGAREMYQHLLDVQTEPGMLHNLALKIGNPDRSWNLPPLESTPYSDDNLAAPPPLRHSYTRAELEEACATMGENRTDHERIADSSEQTITTSRRLQSPETLPPPERDASIEEARTILRWLRNLSFGDRDTEQWLDQGTPAEQVAKADAVSRLVEIFAGQVHKAEQNNPEIRRMRAVEDGGDAAGALALGLSEHALALLPADHPTGDHLENLMEPVPQGWEMRSGQPVTRLLDLLAAGIERAAGTEVDQRSPAEKLIEMSERIQQAAYKLRSVDMLEEPAREESLELAREILRRLKNMKFTDKSSQEVIDSGRPDEKVAIAQQLDELVESYKTLLQEAAQSHPEILQDQRIRDANETVGSFAHSVKLMAAKEIPVSMAATQQISADVTQMPEEWKNMGDRAVGRLVQNMEGGLEKAMGDIEAQQQQQQQQDEDMAQSIIDQSLQQSSGSRRKKRRRGSGGGTRAATGGGGHRQRRHNAAQMPDEHVVKQVRYEHAQTSRASSMATSSTSSPVVSASAMATSSIGLRPEDLAAVKALGGSLHKINKQASTMPTQLESIVPGDKFAPDDKNFATRNTERQTRDRLQNNSPKV